MLRTTFQSLSLVFEEGLALGERISWSQADVGKYTPKEIVDFGFQLSNKIRSLQVEYSVWATEKEKDYLKELQIYIREWVRNYAEYVKSKENIPLFNEFLDVIENKLQNISRSIRSTLE